jgi:C_GCAxxG_C_C family probable redox protein
MSHALDAAVLKNLEDGYLCSESVLLAAAGHMGLAWDRLPAIATGLGGGMGGLGHVCGALAGATLALGMAKGRNTPGEDLFACMADVQVLAEDFAERFGSIDCRDILGESAIDLRTEEGRARAMAMRLPELPCKDCCLFAVRALTKLLPARV